MLCIGGYRSIHPIWERYRRGYGGGCSRHCRALGIERERELWVSEAGDNDAELVSLLNYNPSIILDPIDLSDLDVP